MLVTAGLLDVFIVSKSAGAHAEVPASGITRDRGRCPFRDNVPRLCLAKPSNRRAAAIGFNRLVPIGEVGPRQAWRGAFHCRPADNPPNQLACARSRVAASTARNIHEPIGLSKHGDEPAF